MLEHFKCKEKDRIDLNLIWDKNELFRKNANRLNNFPLFMVVSKRDGEAIVPNYNKSTWFQLSPMHCNNKTYSQMDNCYNWFSLRNKIIESYSEGFPDVTLGYYDYTQKKFIQDLYIKNFLINDCFEIMDIYLTKRINEFYYNSDIFFSTLYHQYNHFSLDDFGFSNKIILKFIEQLKGLYLRNPTDDLSGQHTLISRAFSLTFKNKNINSNDIFDLLNLLRIQDITSIHLRHPEKEIFIDAFLNKVDFNNPKYKKYLMVYTLNDRFKKILDNELKNKKSS